MLQKKDLLLTRGQRLLLLACMFLFCFGLTLVLVYFASMFLSEKPVAAMRISAVLQDVFAFILPSVATCMIVTHKPAELMCLNRRIQLPAVLMVVGILVASIPLQESIIYWNNNISFPESLQAFAREARAAEDRANAAMLLMLSDTSVVSLILNILIVGVGAGFSEELLFRGTFQRLLTTGGINRHVAVWSVAFVFSALHMQLFGFVPRMLLGAYFGYLLLWTGSIWMPILAHTLNNSIFVITAWHQLRYHPEVPFSADSELWPWLWIAASTLLTTLLLAAIRSRRNK